MKPIWFILMMQIGFPVLAESPPSSAPQGQTPLMAYHCYVYDKMAPLW